MEHSRLAIFRAIRAGTYLRMEKPISQNVNQERRLLSTAEAAYYLNVSRWTVDRLRVAGSLPAIRYFKHLRFDRSDLDDFIDRVKKQ